jgi:hypothetical protein
VESEYGNLKATKLGSATLKPYNWGKKKKWSRTGLKIQVIWDVTLW